MYNFFPSELPKNRKANLQQACAICLTVSYVKGIHLGMQKGSDSTVKLSLGNRAWMSFHYLDYLADVFNRNCLQLITGKKQVFYPKIFIQG